MAKLLTTAELIRKLHAEGFVQERIAEECELSQPTVSNYIAGNHKHAREHVALRVRAAYERLMASKKKAA